MSKNKVLDMLYRHEKPCFQRKQTRFDLSLAITILHLQCSSFIWFANTTQNIPTTLRTKFETFPFLLIPSGVSCLSAQNMFMKPCFHELTMEYSIFEKIYLSRVFPLVISTVGMKILKEESNLSWCNISISSTEKIMVSLWRSLKTVVTLPSFLT
jgi:hypothetical protein